MYPLYLINSSAGWNLFLHFRVEQTESQGGQNLDPDFVFFSIFLVSYFPVPGYCLFSFQGLRLFSLPACLTLFPCFFICFSCLYLPSFLCLSFSFSVFPFPFSLLLC